MIDLERTLRLAATGIDWPDADLTGPVVARITTAEKRTTGSRRWIQVALAAAAIAIFVVATPAGRQAVADLLEVAGIRVSWSEQTVTPVAELELGEQVSLEEAAEMASFPLLSPIGAEVGEADGVYFSDFPPGGAVHLVWESDRSLPAAGETGVGLLYSQFKLEAPGGFTKTVQPGSEARRVQVRDNDGFWIEGVPHIIFYEDETGSQERARLAANVLAWEEGGVTHRIETTLALDDALRLAESLRPIS
ncbi:MAG TPA: hypothetical protein VMS99_16450 [Acidimicrobiia bacterium]|nr:hypothetical protein [Acidimicrobiia bacterium]